MTIVELMLNDVNKMLAPQHLHIHVAKAVEEKLVDLGYDPSMGARPLRRTIQDQIEDGIAEFYLDHPEVKELEAVLRDDKIVIRQKEAPAPTEPAKETDEETKTEE